MTNALYKIIYFLKSKEFPDREKERKLMQRFSASGSTSTRHIQGTQI